MPRTLEEACCLCFPGIRPSWLPNSLQKTTTSTSKEATKLTFGQRLQIAAPHAVETLWQSLPDRWLSNACIGQYQALLLDTDCIEFLSTSALNPVTLLPDHDASIVIHNCMDIIDSVSSLRADLTDVPPAQPEATLFTDNSSYLQGTQMTGATVTTKTEVI